MEKLNSNLIKLIAFFVMFVAATEAMACYSNWECSTSCTYPDVGICVKQEFQQKGYCACISK